MENDILLFGESEIMVKTLRKFSLEEIGSAAWKRQHEYLNKLNQQSQPGIHKSFLIPFKNLCIKKFVHVKTHNS